MFNTTYNSDEKSVTQDVFHLLSNIDMNLSNSESSQKVDGKYSGAFGTGVTELNKKIKEIEEQADLDKDKSTQVVLAQFSPSEEQQAISKALSAQTEGHADASEERFDSKVELGDLDGSLKNFLYKIPDFVDVNGKPISKKHQGLIENAYFDVLNKLKTDINKRPSDSLKIIKNFQQNIESILNLGSANQATYSSNNYKSLAPIPFDPKSRMGRFAALMSLVVGNDLTSSARSVSSGGSSHRSGYRSSSNSGMSSSLSPRSFAESPGSGSINTSPRSTGSNRTAASTKSSLDEWGDDLQSTVDGSSGLVAN